MIQFVAFVLGLTGQVDAEFLENARVDLGQDHGGVDFKSLEVLQLIDGRLGVGIGDSRDGERDRQEDRRVQYHS